MAKKCYFENLPLWKFPKLSGVTYQLKSFQIGYIFEILSQNKFLKKIPTVSLILTLLSASYERSTHQ